VHTVLANCPRYNIEMNQYPLVMHQLACCPSCNTRATRTHEGAPPRFTYPPLVPWCLPTVIFSWIITTTFYQLNSCNHGIKQMSNQWWTRFEHFLDGTDYLSETPLKLALKVFIIVAPKTKLLEGIQSDLNVWKFKEVLNPLQRIFFLKKSQNLKLCIMLITVWQLSHSNL